MTQSRFMNNHLRDAFLFFGLALAVVGSLDRPTGFLLWIFKWTSVCVAILCTGLGVAHLVLGSKKTKSQKY